MCTFLGARALYHNIRARNGFFNIKNWEVKKRKNLAKWSRSIFRFYRRRRLVIILEPFLLIWKLGWFEEPTAYFAPRCPITFFPLNLRKKKAGNRWRGAPPKALYVKGHVQWNGKVAKIRQESSSSNPTFGNVSKLNLVRLSGSRSFLSDGDLTSGWTVK